MYSNVTMSTRINSSSVHTYICVCFIRNQYNTSSFYTGFVDPIQYSTWCQNRGCICISSTRRTYGWIHAISCIHPVIQTRTIILQTELFPKKRREKISKERYFNLWVQYSTRITTRSPVFPHAIQSSHAKELFYINSTYRINSSPRNTTTTRLIPCRQILDILQQLFPVHPSILHGRTRLPDPYNTSSLPVNSTCRNSILGSRQYPHTPYKIP